ncbi:MAG: cupin-like domain-containing protein [Erythrobacter sp.]|nr:cupin-like domain-containing protein [Erythrobacter sp.]
MNAMEIPKVSHREFKRLASRNPNLLHENPWIVDGYIRDWPAYDKWRDFDCLRQAFGKLEAFAKAPNFITHRKSSLVSVKTRFDQYLDYIEDPERAEQIYEGCWLEGDFAEFSRLGLPLYCGTLRMIHKADDPLFREVDPLLPEPLKEWNHALPYYYTLFNHFWLLVSLPGALTPLHTDNNGTIALIAQLRGKKRATLFSPADLQHVRTARGDFFDPKETADPEFPTASLATRWHGDIEAGQVLFVGTNWAHHVETLETSVSVSFDFVDKTNLDAYATSSAWAAAFGLRLKRKPELVMERMPGLFAHNSLAELDDITIGRMAMAEVLQQSLERQPDAEARSVLRTYSSALSRILEPTATVQTA